VQFPAVSDEMKRLIPGRPERAMSVSSAGANFANVHQVHVGSDALSRFSDRTLSLQIWLSGDIPDGLMFQCTFDFGGGGGSAAVNTSVLLHAKPYTNGLYRIRRKLVLPTTFGKTIGTGTGLSGPRVTFSLKAGNSGNATWATTFYCIKGALSQDYDAIERPEPIAEDALLDRFLEYIQFEASQLLGAAHCPGTGVATRFLPWQPKIVRPATAIFRNPAVGDFVVNAIDSGATNTIVVDSARSGYIRVEPPALVSGAFYPMTVGAGANPLAVIDTGI
jgi:hypothetical protein